MNNTDYIFPFGSVLKKVEQKDKLAKKVFVLGVYASAVHAKWINKYGKIVINALAVASEPEIFWKGDSKQASDIISQLNVPVDLGHLEPANENLNGPSGKALDGKILNPLGYDRKDAWLCDLIPYSRLNESQKIAIDHRYAPLIKKYCLPVPNVPTVPKHLTDEVRRKEILSEIVESKADMIILLGDKPIQWFLDYYLDEKIERLINFSGKYGEPRELCINNNKYLICAFAHPRQIAGLGFHNPQWLQKHEEWMENKNSL